MTDIDKLYQQLLLPSDELQLSPGQMEEIDRVNRDYPEFTDDEFVREFRKKEIIK